MVDTIYCHLIERLHRCSCVCGCLDMKHYLLCSGDECKNEKLLYFVACLSLILFHIVRRTSQHGLIRLSLVE